MRLKPKHSFQDAHTRRSFLSGAGGACLALPILPSLLTSGTAKAAADAPKRFIAIFSGNGLYSPEWYPSQIPNAIKTGPNIHETNLSDINGPISNILGPEFDAIRSKLLLIRGLDQISENGRDHWPGKMLTGFAMQGEMHLSIDQVMARSSKVYQEEPAVRVLNAKVPGPSLLEVPHALSYAKVGYGVQPVVPMADPTGIFQMLFPIPIGSSRRRIVDHLRDDYQRLLSNSRLSREDRSRLDQHMTLLDDLNRRLGLSSSMCQAPARPEVLGETDTPAITTAHMDLVVNAIKCNLTKVVTLEIGSPADGRSYSFVPDVARIEGPGKGSTFHFMTHNMDNPYNVMRMSAINRWTAKQVADLLTKLDVVEDPETGRTYLDNSIVYWGSESGAWGSDPTVNNVHTSDDMIVLLAGSAGGRLQTGRYINYQAEVKKKFRSDVVATSPLNLGRPINELFITLMLAMGLSPEDWETEGQKGFGSYADNYLNQYDIGDQRTPLPRIFI
ncbi:MAG TPA: DUF1552 domain-containing protein [Oligoflexus sp.]|uniref:DUF1552 domain-containing protein n=1 Tax=Oligoflexus sp. TaxID=1971216 RepID=UPI002D3668C9|nr:DUF1552 domain-containing protein [Oligoflexus sp.]HYX35359.1 DUF1552 domain-containing protein [Oligoflexus sp.]